jgi:hypothetical protein
MKKSTAIILGIALAVAALSSCVQKKRIFHADGYEVATPMSDER